MEVKSPLDIQQTILQKTNNAAGVEVVDANNTFMIGVEIFSTLVADITHRIQKDFEALYAHRAHTYEDLFKHISDFDYTSLYANPSNAEIYLYLMINDITKFATTVSPNLYKMSIPMNAVFMIAGKPFGIYYPIDIYYTSTTGQSPHNFSVQWDVSTPNPLNTLAYNTLESHIQSYKGLPVLAIKVPVFQFERTEYEESINNNEGFQKLYTITDKFYALDAWYTDPTDSSKWKQFKQALAYETYSPEEPTMFFTLLDESTLKVYVPRVYFNTNLIGNTIRITIYTTEGELSLVLNSIDRSNVTMEFTGVNEFSIPVEHSSFLQLVAGSTTISGGRDNLSFDEFKTHIINDTLSSNLLITPDGMSSYFKNNGYMAYKYRDGVTNRTIMLTKPIVNLENHNIGTTTAQITLNSDLINVCDGLTIDGEDCIISPITWFLYDESVNTAYPVPDTLDPNNASVQALIASNYPVDFTTVDVEQWMTTAADQINDYTLVKTPFHIRLKWKEQYPIAESFLLGDPQVTELQYVATNQATAMELVVTDASIAYHDRDTTPSMSGLSTFEYELTFLCYATADLLSFLQQPQIDSEDPSVPLVMDHVRLYLEFSLPSGRKMHVLSNAPTLTEQNKLLFTATISSTGAINDKHQIQLSGLKTANDTLDTEYYDLSSSVSIVSILLNDLPIGHPDIPIVSDASVLDAPMQEGNTKMFFPITKQQITVDLGMFLPYIKNSVSPDVSALQYLTYADTVYATYPINMYNVYTEDVGTNPVTTYVHAPLLHQEGSFIFKDNVIDPITVTAIDGTTDNTIYLDKTALLDTEITLLNTNQVNISGSFIARDTYIVSAVNNGTNIILTLSQNITVTSEEFTTLIDKKIYIINTIQAEITNITGMDITIQNISGQLDVNAWYLSTDVNGNVIEHINDCISGLAIVPGSHVVKYIDNGDDTYTLTLDTTPPDALTADNNICYIGTPKIKHATGSIMIENGAPTIDKERSLNYRVTGSFIDGKLYNSDSLVYTDLRTNILQQFRTIFDFCNTARSKFLELTPLTFQPSRTLGTGIFKNTTDTTLKSSLAIIIKLRLYVSQATLSQKTVTDRIYESILNITYEALETSTFSCSALIQNILATLPTEVIHIDILSPTIDYQTLVPIDEDIQLSLATKRIKTERNTIEIQPQLLLEFVSS